MVAAPDADLHARLAHFHDAYRKAEAAGAACVALREQLEALPFCPERVDPQSEPFERWKRYSDRWGRYMEQGGVDRLGEQFSVLISNAGEAAIWWRTER